MTKSSKITFSLITLWIISLLAMPYIERYIGEESIPYSVSISVILQVSAVISILFRSIGVSKTLIIALKVFIISWIIELIGSKTGIPFGVYHYTDILQPQLLGVPLLIPLAWLMMLPPSWAIARSIFKSISPVKLALLGGLAFTAWDLFLDPQMVRWNLWVWKTEGAYFGIPIINFIGWFVSAVLITLLVRPPDMRLGSLKLIYVLTWIMETVGQIKFWGLIGSAIGGFIGMGIFIAFSYIQGYLSKKRFENEKTS
ncbi:TPA: carotenoid biosynthesis protein [bacterium]|nr:carotenoid biosynthesis protein [bacterium]